MTAVMYIFIYDIVLLIEVYHAEFIKINMKSVFIPLKLFMVHLWLYLETFPITSQILTVLVLTPLVSGVLSE